LSAKDHEVLLVTSSAPVRTAASSAVPNVVVNCLWTHATVLCRNGSADDRNPVTLLDIALLSTWTGSFGGLCNDDNKLAMVIVPHRTLSSSSECFRIEREGTIHPSWQF